MGWLDKIKNVLSSNGDSDPDVEFEKIINDTWKEKAFNHPHFWSLNLNESIVWTNEVKNWPDKKE